MVKKVPTKMEDYKGLKGYSDTWKISNICDGVYKMLAKGQGNLTLKANFGSRTYDIVIFFREDILTTEDNYENGVSTRTDFHYLSMFAKASELSATDFKGTLRFDLNVASLYKYDANLKTGTYYVTMDAKDAAQGVQVIKNFMLVKAVKLSKDIKDSQRAENQEDFGFSLKVTIKPLHTFGEPRTFRDPREELSQELYRMYQRDDNLVDVKIELKHGSVLNAHKFMLAARSPVLKNTIMSGELPQFDGVIKISDADIKPMMAVLHWIYTGQLNKSITQFPEEVLEIAETFQLTGMTDLIDQTLHDFCDTENMTRLYSAAKKYYLYHAEEKLGSFMKGNVPKSLDKSVSGFFSFLNSETSYFFVDLGLIALCTAFLTYGVHQISSKTV